VAALVRRADAQSQNITIDGRFSPAQPLTGPNYSISADLGKQVGSNLFHSFGNFGLATGESAAFSGPATINNVIGRVTGGNQSSIDGKIQSTITGANLYLINPSGIVFGPHATVDVKGSFHASTADYLKMSDGTKFQATNPDASTLSAAPPAAFGFLTPRPAAITVNGTTLGPVPGTLGVVAGPVSIAGAALSAPAGTIHVTSVAGTGEVPVDPRNTPDLTVTSLGPLSVSGGSVLDVSNRANRGSGGSVFIRSGALTINSSEINADNFGSGTGGMISLRGDNQVGLSGSTRVHAVAQSLGRGPDIVVESAGSLAITTGSTVSASTSGLGTGGDVRVNAEALMISSFGGISSDTSASGSGGSVIVNAGILTITPNGSIGTRTSATGKGGSITVTVPGALSIDGTATFGVTGITALAGPGSTGNAGNITVNAGTLRLVTNGLISADTLIGAGNAGTVTVNVAGKLSIDGTSQVLATGISSESGFGLGKAGLVRVNAGSLAITNGGQISASTFGPGAGGDVAVTVTDDVVITGRLGILAETFGSGSGGNVSVTAGRVRIASDGVIATDTQRPRSGNAGSVSLNVVGPLTIDGTAQTSFTGISSSSLRASNGNVGNVKISAGTLSMTNSGTISTRTDGVGAGGTVAIGIDGDAALRGGAVITTSTTGVGDAGSVDVTARGPLTLSDPGSSITASATSTARGNAGSVRVSASQIALMAGSEISSTAAGTGAGGTVTVTTPGALVLDGAGDANTQIAASVTGPQSGSGGTVTVNADILTIRGGAKIASSTAGQGRGSNVQITAASDIVLTDRGSQITARSTGSGDMGAIAVSTVRLLMNNSAAILTDAVSPMANGGNIMLHVRDLLYLVASEINTSVKGETGNGGNITIDPQFVILDHSSIIAQAIAGHGGNIMIAADQFMQSSDSLVSASSQTGVSGTVVINGLVNANGALVVLSTQLRGRTEVLREACAARESRPTSSLVDAGRGGLPQDPEATLPALYIAGREVNPNLQTQADITEASSVLRTTLHLTMRCGWADDQHHRRSGPAGTQPHRTSAAQGRLRVPDLCCLGTPGTRENRIHNVDRRNQMRISNPSRFRKKGKSIVDVVRGFGFPAMLSGVVWASAIAMQSHPANAMYAIVASNPDPDASLEAYLSCEEGGGTWCDYVYVLADPRVQSVVSSFHLELRFDPHLYTFDQSRSVPLCDFANDSDSACPPTRARLGTYLIRSTAPLRGTPPPGANLKYSGEPSSGYLILDYAVPKGVNLSKDKNVFALAFHLTKPITADVTLTASYFKTPGAHQFNQIAFSCNGGAIRCGGHPAVLGFDISIKSKPQNGTKGRR
jgi:filamentous hemagglutinin family protein